MRLDILRDNLLRLRIVRGTEDFSGTGLNRYGFILDLPEENLKVREQDNPDGWEVATSVLNVTYSGGSGELTVKRVGDGQCLLRQTFFDWKPDYAKVEFLAGKDEDWLGFGDQTRDRLYHRGHIADCIGRNVIAYIPVPFFMSTAGSGVLINTTHRVFFDMCKSDPDKFFWKDKQRRIDYYILGGKDFRETINLYTELTGRPKLPPVWSFGLWYICRTQANSCEAVNDALNFRREEIPCDVIGLEPGWMETFYDLTTGKDWDPTRFPKVPPKLDRHSFISALKRMGFKLELWLCNEYDLSYEAERRAGKLDGDLPEEPEAVFHPDGEPDEHFLVPRYDDKITKKDESWFEHLKKFVDQGVDFFKQDPAFQVQEHPNRVWGNGMLDGEMHNLYPLLYSRQMQEGFEEHTSRRAVVFTTSGWIGFQAWSGTWTGDTGGRLDTLGAMLNTAIAGHSWATNDMEVMEMEGIHFGYLQPMSQINSWNYFRMPWIQGDKLAEAHRFYSKLRARLIPYIYSWAWLATRTGYPLIVPLTLEFPGDAACRENLHQYLLGRDLMVAIYKHEIYFPAGRWRDFWTGEIITGPCTKTVEWPENRGGGLYVRTGAIIPFGPLMQFRGEKPLDNIELQIFPDTDESVLEFYEDDGTSLKHRDGEYAVTKISAAAKQAEVKISIGETIGEFAGKINNRTWSFAVVLDFVPGKVAADGKYLPPETWNFDQDEKVIAVAGMPGPVELIITK